MPEGFDGFPAGEATLSVSLNSGVMPHDARFELELAVNETRIGFGQVRHGGSEIPLAHQPTLHEVTFDVLAADASDELQYRITLRGYTGTSWWCPGHTSYFLEPGGP